MANEGVATRRGGLLRTKDFRRLWLADALSQVGSRIDLLAIPLLATTVLSASVFEVSLLKTLATLPYLVLGLQVGAWCDRIRQRPVLVAADLGRVVLIGSIPFAAVAHLLTLWHLFAVVLLAGVFGVLFDVAHQTYLPHLVARADLPEANARLQTNASVAAVAGPSLAGLVIEYLGYAGAMAADAASYLWSALWLRRIETPDVPGERSGRHLRHEIAEGLKAVLDDPILRAITVHGAVSSLFQSMFTAINVVFLSRELGLSPVAIGLLSTVSLTGALLASAIARPLGQKAGAARALTAAAVVYGGSFLLNGFTTPGWGLSWYVGGGFAAGFGIILMNVYAVSFRQAVAPRRLLGRVTSVSTTLLRGMVALGSLAGGVLAEVTSLRTTLFVVGVGLTLSTGILLASPLRKLRDLPD
ncbi:MFS transporter [Amycolatopsis rhabdoformis]|uniref:MFS transporter n=1 Tax=Amycolatopsis rhabdoformis TaxID=1448059 RepID=A0ABZ1I2Y1_9PSEU|nr:MFS transporter [Amycolatopsis rhabdoformis]WSE28738.1 MFS transporter [Amycolatopsis rhabdoformis]